MSAHLNVFCGWSHVDHMVELMQVSLLLHLCCTVITAQKNINRDYFNTKVDDMKH